MILALGFALGPVREAPGQIFWTPTLEGSPGFGQRQAHASVVFNGAMWVTGGVRPIGNGSDEVWSSVDGANWILVTAEPGWEGRIYHASTVHNSRMWIMGGTFDGVTGKNDVWSTADGVDWTQATAVAPWAPRIGSKAVVFLDRMWLIGGLYDATPNDTVNSYSPLSDVWSSPDGVTWTLETDTVPWPARGGHRLVVFDGRMWLMAGVGAGAATFNDVWYTEDGVTWTAATTNAPWDQRRNPTVLVHAGRMWLIAGQESRNVGDAPKNDVWSSGDGANWRLENAPAEFPVRINHASVVFDESLWVFGGANSSGFLNGVWRSNLPNAVSRDIWGALE